MISLLHQLALAIAIYEEEPNAMCVWINFDFDNE